MIDPRAGTLASSAEVLDLVKLTNAFFANKPDVSVPGQRVSFGTSGHRGSAFDTTFNENHIAAITQAICCYRASQNIVGPLYVGRDTHALSEAAFYTSLEVLAANDVVTMIDKDGGFTPTPVVSHAILSFNRGRTDGLADGIVITPSHNPPEDGGFKYNSTDGGPASTLATLWIETLANRLLEGGLRDVKRIGPIGRSTPNVAPFDFARNYISDLKNVVDLDLVRSAGVRIGVDPLNGAAAHYWEPIAAMYGLDLTVTDLATDPTFKGVPRDWDGKIRMDCSSRFPMSRLLARKDEFDVAFANDADADRHGIVTPDGLMLPNDYLASCAFYLGRERGKFSGRGIGKTVVSSSMIDRVAAALKNELFEVPVGFKWFVSGLLDGSLYFAGEESAGSSFLRRDGSVWTTDKDGLIAGLLSAEITAKIGKHPGSLFSELTRELGKTWYARIDQPADAAIRARLAKISSGDVRAVTLGGNAIVQKIVAAPSNGAPIGGVKLSTAKGWIAARPSGTEDIYKIYAESFISEAHLGQLQADAKTILRAL